MRGMLLVMLRTPDSNHPVAIKEEDVIREMGNITVKKEEDEAHDSCIESKCTTVKPKAP